MRKCAHKHFSLVPCCEGFLDPASLTQRNELRCTEVQFRDSVSGHSATHRAEHLHVVRLEAALLGLHVAVELSKIKRACATALPAKLGGATGPYLSLVHDVPLLAKRPRRPRTSYFVPGEFWGSERTERCFLCVVG